MASDIHVLSIDCNIPLNVVALQYMYIHRSSNVKLKVSNNLYIDYYMHFIVTVYTVLNCYSYNKDNVRIFIFNIKY